MVEMNHYRILSMHVSGVRCFARMQQESFSLQRGYGIEPRYELMPDVI
jgi:hypothetical protein